MPVAIQRMLFALTIASLLTSPTYAWNAAGHQVVGAIADRLIVGSPAQREVRRILGDESLQSAAVWADCVRGVAKRNSAFVFKVEQRYSECRPYFSPAGQAEMVSYVQRNWTACKPKQWQEVCHAQYHYSNIAIERAGYSRQHEGGSDHDVVAAIGAAIAVLQGKASPPPFDLNRKEALRLLAHFVGDLHQPLHVGAVYLDARGALVDPDERPSTSLEHTRGGNRLIDADGNLHAEWDNVPERLAVRHLDAPRLAMARAVTVTRGPISQWPTDWATETLAAGRQAFTGVAFGPRNADARWPISEGEGYDARRERLQEQQLLRAGARLAQVLQAVFAQ